MAAIDNLTAAVKTLQDDVAALKAVPLPTNNDPAIQAAADAVTQADTDVKAVTAALAPPSA